MNFKPHSAKQEKALFTQKRILVLGTGTQFGKTVVGALRMKMMMHRFTSPDDAFILTSPSYPIMIQSSLPPFLRIMDGYGIYNKKENCFRMYNGGTCWFRTETDPDSVVGITNVRHIWADECGKYRLYFWENLQSRADFCGATIDLTTSPYALNWIYKELIKPVQRGLREDVELVQAASWENPFHSLHDPKKRAEKMATMDLRRFKMVYGGQWDRMEGLVYDCWSDEENLVSPFQFPMGTQYYGGIDWGYYPDPFAVKIRAITPTGNHYGISEFVKHRMTITDIVQLLKQKNQIYGVKKYFCDPSQPGYIEELNRNGIVAEGADNDIRRGIDLHYEMIKSRKYKEFRGACPHTADELETYHYPEEKDLKPDENSREMLPVDQHNHCFTGDTLIETIHGPIRIDSIRPGELVLTRLGYKRVVDQWCEGKKKVIEVLGLRCTPDHKIYTKNRSFVEAQELNNSDSYITLPEWKTKSNSWARHILFTATRSIIVAVPVGFMWWFGSTIMGLCLKAITSIIRTAIRLIIGLRTWSWSERKIICLIMQSFGTETQRTERDLKLTSQVFRKKRSLGMARRREDCGIASMHLTHLGLRCLDQIQSAVFTVTESLKSGMLWGKIEKSIAPSIASLRAEGNQGWTISKGNASAATPHSKLINMHLGGIAPTNAARGEELVYNLMVEAPFEYFANEILVSNCLDLDRYLTISTYGVKDKNIPKEAKEKASRNRLDQLKKVKRTPHTESWQDA